MHSEIDAYNHARLPSDRSICKLLAHQIDLRLPDAECRIWHGHPVWFINDNPIVGYCKLKDSIQLLFWSGQSFDEGGLRAEGKFKAAEVRYTSADQVNLKDLHRWLEKAKNIQWDYKNLVKRKGQLERLV